MWLRIANFQGQTLMPLFVWTVCLVAVFLTLTVWYKIDHLRFFGKSDCRFFTLLASLWLIHFGVIWYVIRCLVGFAWLSQLHLSHGEEVQTWYEITIACSEMGLLSTLFVIWSSIVLLGSFTRHAILQNHPVKPNLLTRLESE